MTKLFIKELFSEFYMSRTKMLLVIAVFSFYSTYSLTTIDNYAYSVWEYALLGMSDHYYITFFFLLMYIVIISKSIKDSNALILLRSSRYHFYYISKMAALAVFTLSIVFFHVIILLIIGSFKHGWSNAFFDNSSELSVLYQESFRTPLSALISVSLYLSLGFCVIASALSLVSHYFSEKAVIIVEVVFYLIIIVVLHLNIDSRAPLFFINCYIFLHRAIGYKVPIASAFISIMALFSFIFLANRQRTKIIKRSINALLPFRVFGEMLSLKNAIITIVILIALSSINVIKNKTVASSGLEHIVLAFWGYGLGYLSLIDFLHLVMFNGFPIYILAMYFGNSSSTRCILMIRYKYINSWFKSMQISMLALILWHMAFTCLFTSLIGIAATKSAFLDNSILGDALFKMGNPISNIIIGLTLRTLELMFLQITMLVIFSLLKNITTSFLITMFMYLSVAISSCKYIPFGLSSLSRVLELSDYGFAANAAISAAVFVCCYAVMYFYLRTIGNYRMLNFERGTN